MRTELMHAPRVRAAHLVLPLVLLAYGHPAQADDHESVIIGCGDSCASVMSRVHDIGGTISHEYKNVDAVVARFPIGLRAALTAIDGVAVAYKDAEVANPSPTESFNISVAPGTAPILGQELDGILDDLPAHYNFNNSLIGATPLHLDGFTGDGVVVAVIDSGTANNELVVPAIAGDVIGGENLVPGAGEPSATSTLNDAHGTWVATQISADIGFLFNSSGKFAQSLLEHAPDSIIPEFVPGQSLVPMVGVAPDASIYAMKIFSAAGGGAPVSRVIAAMDRAITLRRNFDSGMPSVPVSGDGSEEDPFVYESLDIQVVNMSLGGATLFAGNDLKDRLTQQMLEVGITLVSSAGNGGHAAMTGRSSGTGIGTLTAGAASTAAHERILRDLQFGLGTGSLYRPTDHIQMATFSSRGPSADGRISTNAVANGLANFAQSANGGLFVLSGTSFSAPQMAGAAALLRDAVPGASAVQIRNALEDYANPNLLGDGSAPIDQGRGMIDIPAALAALEAGKVRKDLDFGRASKSVRKNIKSLGLKVIRIKDDPYRKHLSNFLPGQVEHVFLRSHKNTDSFTISFTNIQPELPLAEQNLFFGDDIFVKVQDALTSDEETVSAGFLIDDTEILFDKPQTGIVRIAIMGDWTNAGRISADLEITEVRGAKEDETEKGKVGQSETDVVLVDIPAGAGQATFDLSWRNNWGAYPTDDLDLILVDPSGVPVFDGVTLASPERVIIDSPLAGTWVALIDGFTVHGVIKGKPFSKWKLVAQADGKLIELDDDDD